MLIRPRKFQEGGAVAPEEMPQEEAMAAEQPQEGQDPMMLLAQMAAQAIQTGDCNAAMQVCQILLEMLQQAGAEAEEQPSEPVMRRDGGPIRVVRRIR